MPPIPTGPVMQTTLPGKLPMDKQKSTALQRTIAYFDALLAEAPARSST